MTSEDETKQTTEEGEEDLVTDVSDDGFKVVGMTTRN